MWALPLKAENEEPWTDFHEVYVNYPSEYLDGFAMDRLVYSIIHKDLSMILSATIQPAASASQVLKFQHFSAIKVFEIIISL